MTKSVIDFKAINDLPKNGDHFFKVMLRLEYALKELGVTNPSQANGKKRVAVDWDKFVNDRLKDNFYEEIRDSKIASTLVTKPPSHQIQDNRGNLDWEKSGEISNKTDLIGAVRRVRNNLFHGGKSGRIDKDRDDQLVEDALCIVYKILESDEDVRMYFEGKA